MNIDPAALRRERGLWLTFVLSDCVGVAAYCHTDRRFPSHSCTTYSALGTAVYCKKKVLEFGGGVAALRKGEPHLTLIPKKTPSVCGTGECARLTASLLAGRIRLLAGLGDTGKNPYLCERKACVPPSDSFVSQSARLRLRLSGLCFPPVIMYKVFILLEMLGAHTEGVVLTCTRDWVRFRWSTTVSISRFRRRSSHKPTRPKPHPASHQADIAKGDVGCRGSARSPGTLPLRFNRSQPIPLLLAQVTVTVRTG